MKKYIIISGVPRAGKSTVSNMIAQKFDYHHISMDSVIAGIERVFPESGIDTEAELPFLENLRIISGKIAPFIRAMIDSGEYDEFEQGAVIDVYQLLPEDYVKFIAGENCGIFYFLTADVTAEERFAIMRRHDAAKDYTRDWPDGELLKSCAELVEESRFLREECAKHGLPCYETSTNRAAVLEAFMKDLQEEERL